MSRKNYQKLADEEFAHLPVDYQEDWGELKETVEHR
jgi:hypothetical protein